MQGVGLGLGVGFYEALAWVQAEINPDVAVAAGLWQREELVQQEARKSSVRCRSALQKAGLSHIDYSDYSPSSLVSRTGTSSIPASSSVASCLTDRRHRRQSFPAQSWMRCTFSCACCFS